MAARRAVARTLVAAVLLAVAAILDSPVAAERAASMAACSAPAYAVTYKCASRCGASVPCLTANATATNGTSSCDVTCLDRVYDEDKLFALLVTFGVWTNTHHPSGELLKHPKTEGKHLMVNNDKIEAVEPLKLPANITEVWLVGGHLESESVKGWVANVKLAQGLLANSSSVTIVDFSDLNLQPQTDAIAAMMPPNVAEILLDNDLFTAFPKGLGAIKTLTALSFQRNYLTGVDSTFGMDALTELYLNENNITSFTAAFPKLQILDLSQNKLTEIPSVVSKYPALETLSMSSNSLTAIPIDHAAPPTLKTLDLSDNNITTFEGSYPKLKALNLADNDLTAIPPLVFGLTKLTSLYLAGNPIKVEKLTTDQFHFLAGLGNFTINEGVTTTDCGASEKKTIRSVTFCVESAKASSSSSLGLILGIVGGVLALAVIGGVVYVRSRKHAALAKATTYTNADGTISTMNVSNGTGLTSLWYDVDLLSVKINDEEIEDVKVLGKGAFGDVWLVKYRKTQLLASKRLRKSDANRARTQNFIDEIKLVAKLEHPCIVAFVGAAWTIESDLQALFEFMDGGDLRDHLTNSSTPREWTPEKLQIAIDIAEALVYVHSFAPPLVHRDLKSRNVLLSSELRAKLTDFGVSRFRSEDNTMTSGVGTGKWLAPEVITGDGTYGAPADIFSFGAVLTELDSHELPYDDVRGPNGVKLADIALLQLIASGELRPHFGASCPAEVAELGARCFALDPAARPAAPEIAYALRQMKKSLFAA